VAICFDTRYKCGDFLIRADEVCLNSDHAELFRCNSMMMSDETKASHVYITRVWARKSNTSIEKHRKYVSKADGR
jgi:hypothetical protein